MIYTVTLNPSVDFVTRLDALVPGTVNASREECLSVDGRALTISRILHTLDVPTTATGFIGGQTGSYVEDILEEEGILNDFILLVSFLYSFDIIKSTLNTHPTVSLPNQQQNLQMILGFH